MPRHQWESVVGDDDRTEWTNELTDVELPVAESGVPEIRQQLAGLETSLVALAEQLDRHAAAVHALRQELSEELAAQSSRVAALLAPLLKLPDDVAAGHAELVEQLAQQRADQVRMREEVASLRAEVTSVAGGVQRVHDVSPASAN